MSFMTELVRTVGKGKVIVAGSFQPNGSGSINAALNQGKGWSVIRNASAGLYLITFDKPWNQLTAAVCSVMMNSPGDDQVVLGAYSPATSSAKATLALQYLHAGSAADLSANANNQIHFACIFKNTNAPG